MAVWLFPRSRYAVDTHYGDHIAGAAPKIVLHTPEIPDRSAAEGGLESVIRQVQAGKSKPVYQVYVSVRNRQVLQVGRLDRAGGSLRRPTSTETNRAGVLAVVIAGYAGDMHRLSADDLAWLGRTVIRPIAVHFGVDLEVVWGPNRDSSGYGYGASQRIQDQATWYAARGLMCHQHAKDQTHWDCGQIDTLSIAVAARGQQAPPPSTEMEDDDVALIATADRSKGYTVTRGVAVVPFGGAREPVFGTVDARLGGNAVVAGFDDDGVTLMDPTTGAPLGNYYNLRGWMGG